VQRHGFWNFVALRKALFIAIFCGLSLIGLTVWFTYWLATQTFSCPDWANDCDVRPSVAWITHHYPFVQSVVSTVHGIGLSILAYPAFIFAEAAIWPMLTRQSYNLVSLDMYLSATRGSVPSLLQAIWNASTGRWSNVMVGVGLITLLTTADRLVVGIAYTQGNVTTTYHSNYSGGAGIGLAHDQRYPPGVFPAPITFASMSYTSWAMKLSSEPLPEFREFFIDRTKLARRGNFSVSGLQATKTINCSGQPLEIEDFDDSTMLFRAKSNYPEKNSYVRLRMQSRLAVWVDDVDYKSATRTITTLVFAAINGSIENGVMTDGTTKMQNNNAHEVLQISSLKCLVDVTLKESTIAIGTGPSNGKIAVSSLDTLKGPGNHKSKTDSGDVAQWMAAVVASLGSSVYGAQPLFSNDGPSSLPIPYTTSTSTKLSKEWTQNQLINFINVTSGALALSMSTQWADEKIILTSSNHSLKLVPSNCWLLLVPAALALLITVFLAWWLCFTYRRTNIREMCTAKTSDIIWSTQNQSLREGVEEARLASHSSEKLDQMKVRYTVLVDEDVHMGLIWDKSEQYL
jgi:hypothetical protein